jgi:Ca2+-binding RTX toxin-like protein
LGNDIYVLDSIDDVIAENADEGTDTVQTAMTLSGLAANVENVTLTGSTAIHATGNDLDNVLTGNAAINTLTGGLGNDTLNGAAGADILVGGLGNDTYIVDNVGDVVTEILNEGLDTIQSSITLASLAVNVENLTLTGTGAINATGNELNNTLTGNTAANILNGGLGADTLIGGLGNDTYVVDDAGDVVTETSTLATEIDTVQASISYVLNANVEKLTLTGTANINATGNELNNTLTGNAGNNILDGGLGNDTMVGGLGDDTYIVDVATDIVTEAASAGIDTVQSGAANYTLATNVENLVLMGTGNINGTGNTLANTLTGNAGDNILNGGTGADNMLGGLGNDTYLVDNIADVVTEGVDAGVDTIESRVTYSLSSNLENLTLAGTSAINGSGNDLSNILTGNAAANILNGGLGADTLVGGLGNDTYVVDDAGDVVTETSTLATELDTVQASISYALNANVEKLTLTGTANINATGNELNNTLTGNAGNNLLDGGLGNDTMVGGLGDDTYLVNVATDIVTEAAGAGVDTVQSIALNYTLTTHVENLVLTGSANINGTGNTLANTLTGNAGDNTLNGGTGADTLVGGLGNDTYVVDNIGDIVSENFNEGVDTVQSSVTYTISANIENLTLTGTGAINGTGNVLNNYLLGNAGNNSLFGLTGNDILQGLAGNDTLNDTADNNLLDGKVGTDTLVAGNGNDILIGGTGNDTLTTGTGYDVISFNKGDGADIINASTGADNSISLGGAFAYSDLSLTKTGNNLIVKVSATDQLTLKDWYLGTTNKSVVNLQVIAEAMADFNLGASDPLRDNKVENFNFASLVNAFDADVASNAANATNWQLTDTRLTTHLQAGSDTAAIGGDLAYQYGKNSNLTGVGLLAAQNVINNASFGQTAQTLNNPSVWSAEVVKLG